MPLRGHYLQHVPFEKPGVIRKWFREQNGVLTRTQLYRDPGFPPLETIDFLLVLGGTMRADDERDYRWLTDEKRYIESAVKRSIPTMGISLGAQLIASVLGAEVYRGKYREIGWFPVTLSESGRSHPYLSRWPDELTVFHWHGDTFDLPEGTTRLASSKGYENQAFVYADNVIAFQFHTEMRSDDIRYMLEFLDDHERKGTFVQDDGSIRDGLDNSAQTTGLMEATLTEFLENAGH